MTRDEAREAIIAGEYDEALSAIQEGNEAQEELLQTRAVAALWKEKAETADGVLMAVLEKVAEIHNSGVAPKDLYGQVVAAYTKAGRKARIIIMPVNDGTPEELRLLDGTEWPMSKIGPMLNALKKRHAAWMERMGSIGVERAEA